MQHFYGSMTGSIIFRAVILLGLVYANLAQLTPAEIGQFVARNVTVSEYDANHWLFEHNAENINPLHQ